MPGILEMSFRVLYDAVRDVALNPELHALPSQSQPLAASSSSIPVTADAPTVEMPVQSQPLAFGS